MIIGLCLSRMFFPSNYLPFRLPRFIDSVLACHGRQTSHPIHPNYTYIILLGVTIIPWRSRLTISVEVNRLAMCPVDIDWLDFRLRGFGAT